MTGPGTSNDITLNPPADDLAGSIQVPGLRGISRTAPYFHGSSAATLEEAVQRFVDRGAPVPALLIDQQLELVDTLRAYSRTMHL